MNAHILQMPENRQQLATLYIDKPNNIFGAIAELMASVGPEVARELVVI